MPEIFNFSLRSRFRFQILKSESLNRLKNVKKKSENSILKQTHSDIKNADGFLSKYSRKISIMK